MALTPEMQAKMQGAAAGLRQATGLSAPPPAPPPAVPGAAPAPAPTGPTRGPDGKFAPVAAPAEAGTPAPAPEGKPEVIPPIREALKRQKEANKALQAKVAEMEARMAALAAPKPPADDPVEKVIAGMPPETQKWLREGGGRDVIRLEAERIVRGAMAPHEAAIQRTNESLKAEQKNITYAQNLQDWLDDKAAEGEIVSQDDMIAEINDVDRRKWRLGTTDAEHFDAIFGLLKAKKPGSVAPVVTGDAAKEAARKEAEAKARAGGVSPGSSVTPPPSNQREELSKALRDAAWSGDHDAKARLLRERMRGLGVLPSETTFGKE